MRGFAPNDPRHGVHGANAMRAGSVALVLTLALFGACVRAVDAWIVNPCSRPLDIVTYRVASDDARDEEKVRTARLAPESVTRVSGAFSDLGDRQWSIYVRETEHFIDVDGNQWDAEVALIPASACP